MIAVIHTVKRYASSGEPEPYTVQLYSGEAVPPNIVEYVIGIYESDIWCKVALMINGGWEIVGILESKIVLQQGNK